MSDSVRRSGRTRKVNKRYTNEEWDEETSELLRDPGWSGPEDEIPLNTNAMQESSDDEFDETQMAVTEQEDETGSAGSPSPSSSATSSPRTKETTASRKLKEIVIPMTPVKRSVISEAITSPTIASPKSVTKRPRAPKTESAFHYRGLAEIRWKFGRAAQFSAVFGPELDDFRNVVEARDLWALHGRDAVLPSHLTMSQTMHTLTDGQSLIDGVDADATDTEYDHLRAAVRSLQKLDTVPAVMLEAKGYLNTKSQHRLVLGRTGQERTFEVPSGAAIQMGRAWPRSDDSQHAGVQDQSSARDNACDADTGSDTCGPSSAESVFHEGWLINAGSGIRNLAWAPAFHTDTQYLAIVVRSTEDQRSRAHVVEPAKAPAFSRSGSYPASIQIWAFTGEMDPGTKLSKLSTSQAPRLTQILAYDCGDIREIRWLPTYSKKSLEAALGILVTLATDGTIRLLDIPKIDPNGETPSCSKVVKAVSSIESPPGAIFTTFSCTSAMDLIVGASDGTVRLYNLGQVGETPQIQPYSILNLHSSYILSLAMAQHGDLPPLLASASTAGDILLTDLRSPTQDRVRVSKARLPTKNLIYSSHARAWITTVDSSGRTDASSMPETRLIAHPLRHFFVSHQVSRLPQGTGSSTTLAGSRLHPFILTGSTTGTVVCQNVLRRLLPGSRTTRFKPWTLKVCEYEWIPQESATSGQRDAGVFNDQDIDPLLQGPAGSFNQIYYGKDTRVGVSRFQEGFKPEYQDATTGSVKTANTNVTTKADAKRKRTAAKKASSDHVVEDEIDQDEEVVDETQEDRPASNKPTASQDPGAEAVFEEEQAVTAMVWNENPACGTWVAIGWGSGIVRVQDLGHDAGQSLGTTKQSKPSKKHARNQ